MNLYKRTKKFISNLYIEKKQYRKLVNENKQYLSQGNYKIVGGSKNIIYLKDKKTISFINKNILHLSGKKTFLNIIKLNIKKIIINFFPIKLNNNKKNAINIQEIKGTAIMVTALDDFIIFDLNKKLVLNFSENIEQVDLIKRAYTHFNLYFDIPLEYVDKNKKYYIENYIDFKPYNLLDEKEKNQILNSLFDIYIKYYKDYKQNDIQNISLLELINQYEVVVDNNRLSNKIIDILDKDEIEQKSFPKTVQHGDMNFYNVLLTDNKIKVIDWDDFGSYIFFYDFFNLIFVESIYRSDDNYLNNYINGSYDIFLENIFKLMELKYFEKLKKEYMIIFIMERSILQFSRDSTPDRQQNISNFVDNCLDIIKKIK